MGFNRGIFFSSITYNNWFLKFFLQHTFSLLDIFINLLPNGFTWGILHFVIANRSLSLLIFLHSSSLFSFILHLSEYILSYWFMNLNILTAFFTFNNQFPSNLLLRIFTRAATIIMIPITYMTRSILFDRGQGIPKFLLSRLLPESLCIGWLI